MKRTEPLFSIIIPTYNRAYVLWKAIQSVLAQSEARWEIIVVDDGSTDCTLRLLEEFRNERIRVLSISHQGQSAARNRGLEVAQAPFIAYLDSDNTWHPNFLEVMRQAIEQNPACVLWYCGQNSTIWERTENGEWLLISQQAEPRKQFITEEICRLSGADTNCIVHRSEILAEVGGWDEKCFWIEDWDFFLRVSLAFPEKIKWVPQILVEYRQVFGGGADGVCGEAREDKNREIKYRRYLLEKWKHLLDFAAVDKLSKKGDDLSVVRAKT